MKKLLITALLFTSFLARGQNDEILNLTQKEFDSFDCCWRKLSDEKHYAEAAELMAYYIKNSPNAQRKHPLNWHAAQLYASAGNNREATRYIKKTYNLLYRWFGGEDGRQWYYYAKGTTAFLKGNKRQLERMIRLWDKHGYEQEDNYRILTKLLAGWGQTYEQVYK